MVKDSVRLFCKSMVLSLIFLKYSEADTSPIDGVELFTFWFWAKRNLGTFKRKTTTLQLFPSVLTDFNSPTEMQAFWVSLKENVKCGSKLTDVVRHPVRCSKQSSYVSEKNMNRDTGYPMEMPTSLAVSGSSNMPARLHELSIGDPSRKIVEMIFHKAWMHTSKPLRKVRTVFKVSNSAEVLERFEKYREKVKQKASEQYPRHPRSTVDGNEVLRFYGTTMRCCQERLLKKVSDLCQYPSCCVCQMIQFHFNTEYTEGNQIQLNKSSNEFIDYKFAATRVKNVKRAVIVCRIIAGTEVHEVDGEYEGLNSTGFEEQQFSLVKYIIRNPGAILPCFVIVFS